IGRGGAGRRMRSKCGRFPWPSASRCRPRRWPCAAARRCRSIWKPPTRTLARRADFSMARHFPMSNPVRTAITLETRRQFLAQSARGFGALALASLLGETARADGPTAARGGQPGLPHFAPKATRAVYLHMVGAPPQMDLYDYKPRMRDWYDRDLPESGR